MKKLSALICALILSTGLASFAACPCGKSPDVKSCDTCSKVPACEKPSCVTPCPTPCETPKTDDCCPQPKQCCETDECDVVKQQSKCWPLSQTELFKKLCLGNCQYDRACCLYKKFLEKNAPLIERLRCEELKLCQLDTKCNGNKAVRDQKHTIKNVKKQMKTNWKEYQEDLKCVLTPEQVKEMNKYMRDANKTYKQNMKQNCACKS